MYGLEPHIIEKINSVFRQYPQIEKVILYGSRAKGNYKPGSDIDLTLIGSDIDLTLTNQLELSLDDLLLPYTFDLSLFKQITNQNFIDHIERVGVEFYVLENK